MHGMHFWCSQIKGPELLMILGAEAQQEVWHDVQCCTIKDPGTHEELYVISQV